MNNEEKPPIIYPLWWLMSSQRNEGPSSNNCENFREISLTALLLQVQFHCDVDYSCLVNSIRWYHTTPDNETTTQIKVQSSLGAGNHGISSRWFAFPSFWSPSLNISVCFVVEVEEGPLTVIIWYLQWFDCERMIIKWCRAESCICHDYKASAGQSGVGSQDRRLVRLPGAGGGMQNSSISSSRTQHHSGDRWWDSALYAMWLALASGWWKF